MQLGQWLLDNMYIIEEEYEKIKESKKSLKNKRLPIIKTSEGDKYISIFYLAYELVEENHHFEKENDKYYRVSKIYRNTIEKETGNIQNKELIWDNHSLVMFDYNLIPKEQIKI